MEFIKDLFKNFKLNGYLLAELLFVVIFTRIGKVTSKVFWGLLLIPVLLGLFTAFTGKSVVRNFSRRKVYAKCENDDMVFEIDRFKSKSFIDGVKVDNQVFKVRNGYSIWVFNHFVLYPSMTGSLIHLLGRDKLNEAPDEGWQPLFEK